MESGDPVPDRPGRFLCDLSTCDLSESVQVSNFGIVFHAATKTNCSDNNEVPVEGIFRLAFGGSIETLAMAGESANPSPFPGGNTYGRFSGEVGIQNDGIAVFKGRASGVTNQGVIWRCDPLSCPGTIAEAFVVDGDPDPFGNTVGRLSAIGINDAGDVSFYARVNQVLARDGFGIYIRRDATNLLERVAVKGDLVPDAPIPSVFTRVEKPGAMSSGGRLAFRGKMKASGGPTAQGVFLFE